MRHHDKNRKFGRKSNVRLALMRSLTVNLVDKERIETTEARAKELRPFVEKLVGMGKTNTLTSRRLLASRLGGGMETVNKIVNELSPRYKERAGGYTRIVKSAPRSGDGSPMAFIEFIR